MNKTNININYFITSLILRVHPVNKVNKEKKVVRVKG